MEVNIVEKKSLSNKAFRIIEPVKTKKPEKIEQTKKEDEKMIVRNEEMPQNVENKPLNKLPSLNEDIIAKANKLKLTILEGNAIKPGTILIINAGGLIGSKRVEQDGNAYFGTDPGNVK